MNLGSFGMGMGQDAIAQAMQARQSGTQAPPQLDQTLGNPNVPGQAPTTNAAPTPSSKPISTESELIIKALSQRLKAISDVEKPQTPPAMGGGYNKSM